jgi:hypothetical protein
MQWSNVEVTTEKLKVTALKQDKRHTVYVELFVLPESILIHEYNCSSSVSEM